MIPCSRNFFLFKLSWFETILWDPTRLFHLFSHCTRSVCRPISFSRQNSKERPTTSEQIWMDYSTQIVNKCITGCFPQTTHASRCHPLGKWQIHADDSLNVGGYLPHLITKKSKKAWYVGQMGLTEGKTETIKILQEAQNELCEILSLTAHKGKKGDKPKESWTSRWALRGKSTYSQKYLFVFGK